MTADELKEIEARAKSLRERLIAQIVAPGELLCRDLEILTASLRAAREEINVLSENLAVANQAGVEADKLREALEYYACREHYTETPTLSGTGVRKPGVIADGGAIARKALGEE